MHPSVGFNVMGDVMLPRVRIRGVSGNTLSVLQGDRIAFGWQRNVEVGVEVDYPGYDALRASWAEEVSRFVNWLQSQLSQQLLPRLVELTYNNAYPLVVAGQKLKLSDIFKLLNPNYRPVNAFNVAWSEFLDTPTDGVVSAQAGLGHAPPGQRVLAVNYFGLASVGGRVPEGEMVDQVLRTADKLHRRILDMHRSAVIPSV